MTKEEFYSTVDESDRCPESDAFIDSKATFAEAWDTCTEPQWLIRYAVLFGHDISWIRNEDVPDVKFYMDKFDEAGTIKMKLHFISTLIDKGYDSSFCDVIRNNITL